MARTGKRMSLWDYKSGRDGKSDGSQMLNSFSNTGRLSFLTLRGQNILLLGDLEKAGMQHLLDSTELNANVMLAPHHGSSAANTAELIEAVNPEWAVISSGRNSNLDILRERYGEQTTVLSTFENGAVTVEINQQGKITVTPAN